MSQSMKRENPVDDRRSDTAPMTQMTPPASKNHGCSQRDHLLEL
jgi:hypothetical protein